MAPGMPQSFEDTIAAMLRPLLREWLDANMPRMVEKALRDEIGAPPAATSVVVAGAAA